MIIPISREIHKTQRGVKAAMMGAVQELTINKRRKGQYQEEKFQER